MGIYICICRYKVPTVSTCRNNTKQAQLCKTSHNKVKHLMVSARPYFSSKFMDVWWIVDRFLCFYWFLIDFWLIFEFWLIFDWLLIDVWWIFDGCLMVFDWFYGFLIGFLWKKVHKQSINNPAKIHQHIIKYMKTCKIHQKSIKNPSHL